MGRDKTTAAQRIAALRILKQNCYDYTLTAKTTGFGQTALRRWQEKYGDQLNSEKNLTRIAESQQRSLERLYVQFFSSQYERTSQALQTAIDRGVELLPTESDLGKISQFVKVLLDYGKALGTPQGEDKAQQHDRVLAQIQQTVVMLNGGDTNNNGVIDVVDEEYDEEDTGTSVRRQPRQDDADRAGEMTELPR